MFKEKKELFLYGIVVLFSSLILFFSFRLYKVDLRIPFQYDGDAPHALMTVKTIIDNGWFLENKYLASPSGFQTYDFPLGDNNLSFLLIKIITVFFRDTALSVNIFYLLTFILTALTSAYAGRRLGLSRWMTIFFSISFAFLPYHFWRGIAHLLLSAYFAVPLAVLVAIQIAEGSLTLDSFRQRKALAIHTIIIAAILASTGLYYAFFSCFFFLVAGILRYSKEKNRSSMGAPLLLSAIVFSLLLINNFPTFFYNYYNNPNSAAIFRFPAQSEIFGLGISHLITPSPNHRLIEIAEIGKKIFDADIFHTNEAPSEPIGIFASIGFLYLLWRLVPSHKQNEDARLSVLSTFNISAIFLGAIGSFGFLIAVFFAPQIRSYSRLSLFIAFFSLLAITSLFDKWGREFWKQNSLTDLKELIGKKVNRILFLLSFLTIVSLSMYLIFFAEHLWQILLIFPLPLIILMLIFKNNSGRMPTYISFFYFAILGFTLLLIDIPSAHFYNQHDEINKLFLSDKKFITSIENQAGHGGKIFQIPYQEFPEGITIFNMYSYDNFRPYIHSKDLYWSFGSMRGRTSDQQYKELSKLPIAKLLITLKRLNYNGLLINKRGYQDNGHQIISEIERTLRIKPDTDEANTMSFFIIKREKY